MTRCARSLVLTTVVAVLATALLGACATQTAQGPGAAAGQGMAGGPSGSAVYWCGGVADGPASSIATRPGTCPDGKPKNAGHVIGFEGNTALVCVCGVDCRCKVNPTDTGRCGCGKKILKIGLEGTGLYVCNCLGKCDCNTLVDSPGSCRCGMELRQIK